MLLRFDRGTILLDGPDTIDGLVDLPGVRWDPRVGRLRAPGRFHRALVDELVRRGVRFSDGVRDPAGQPDAREAITLRPYQEAALAAWELAGRKGVVALPTGSGKTHVALASIARTKRAALCLVPTRVLLDQWRVAVERAFREAPGIHGDGVRTLGAITIATFESAWRHMPSLGHRFDLLVVDEAHHFGAGLRDEALEMAVAGDRLGLTATPPGGAGATRLAELVGPTVFELSLGDLAGSFLAGFDVITLHLELDAAERSDYDAAIGPFRAAMDAFRDIVPSGSWEDFARWAARSEDGRRALAGWRRARALVALPRSKRAMVGDLLHRHRASRTLVFTADNAAAYALAREHLVMPITCDIPRAERDEALARFRRGELRALCSSRVLNEGLDVPDADVGIIVGGSHGEREHVQRVGRLLRPCAGKRALIYELVARATLEGSQARRRGGSLARRSAAAG